MRKRPVVKDNIASENKLRPDFGDTDFWLPLFVEFLIYVVVFFSLRETLHCLYADDDLVNSLQKGNFFLDGVSVKNYYQYFLYALDAQTNGQGRIMIGSFFTTIPIIFFDVLQYRIYVLILICINIWLFGKCIYQWTDSYKIKWFSMLLAPLFFQIHFNFHHPILMYFGLMQLLFIILFSSMYFFWKYCNEHKKRWLVMSGLFYLWGLVTYEVAFVFILVFILLAYFATKNIKKSVLSSLLHVALFSVVIIVNIIIKTGNGHHSYPGSTISLDILKIIPTTIKQMVATIPLSNFMAVNWAQNGSIVPKLFLVSSVTLDDILTVILFLVALYLIHSTKETNSKFDKKNMFVLGILGFMIVLLPSGLMGLSARYQNEITWGTGHIPVYIQYFGLIILLVAIYLLGREGIKKFDTKKIGISSVNILMVVLSIFILLTNQQYGRAQIKIINDQLYNNMLALQYSLEDGIIGDISDDASIIYYQGMDTFPYQSSGYISDFFINYSQKRLKNVVSEDDFLERTLDDYKVQGILSGTIEYTPAKSTYIVRSNRDPIRGVIYIGMVKNMTIDLDNKKITRCAIDELRIYAMNTVTAKFLSLYEKNDGQSYVHGYYKLLESNLTNTRASIYRFDFNDSVVDFYSTFLVNDIDNLESQFYGRNQINLAIPVVVGNNQSSSDFFITGWSGLEASGRWSDGKRAVLDMKLSEVPDNDLLVTFEAEIFAPKENLIFSVLVNGASVGNFSFPAGRQTFSVLVPKDNVLGANGELEIVFEIKNPESPLDARLSADPRKLGVGLVSFVVEADK